MSASDVNMSLEKFSDEISKLSKDLGFTYYCFCHLKAPDYGPPHERGGKVLSHQFTGSRAMMRSCYYMWGLSRNKDPDKPEKDMIRLPLSFLRIENMVELDTLRYTTTPIQGIIVNHLRILESDVENLIDFQVYAGKHF